MACGGGGDDGSSGVNSDVLVAGARSGGGGSTEACSSGVDDNDGWTPSPAFREQPLEREKTTFFSQMTAKVCWGGVPSPLIEPKMGREGKGPT